MKYEKASGLSELVKARAQSGKNYKNLGCREFFRAGSYANERIWLEEMSLEF